MELNAAMNVLSPGDLYDLMPRTYPKENPVDMVGFKQFPGMVFLDVEMWEWEDQPTMTILGWLKYALKVAENKPIVPELTVASRALRLAPPHVQQRLTALQWVPCDIVPLADTVH